MTRRIDAADLFAGAGGTSTGLLNAAAELGLAVNLIAINHWQIAVATHAANHPQARHVCEDIAQVSPREAVPGGRLKLLVASPECTHHSRARGGKPRDDQSRASAWHVLRWASALYIDNILIENVPEFRSFGPLGANGLPLKSRRGETYQAFLNGLRSLGYAVEDGVLNCANYGDPTTRERLFILARRGRRKIAWPEPTHSADGADTLFGPMQKWRTAREVIDWSVPGESIFNRKHPLSPNTLARIFAGLQKFSGIPFVLPNEGIYRGNAPRSLDQPVPTITQRGAGALVEPFLVMGYRGHDGRSLDEPLPTVTANFEHFGLVQPFVLNIRGGGDGYLRASSVDAPLPTVTTEPPLALVEPFLVKTCHGDKGNGRKRTHSLDHPLPTVTGTSNLALIQPFLIQLERGQNDDRTDSIDRPLPTLPRVDARDGAEPGRAEHRGVEPPLTQDVPNRAGMAQPFLIKYYGQSGGARSVDEPLDTLTTKDRFGLVVPGQQGVVLDIRFRMLRPRELARAMSFPDDYEFAGNRSDVVKQIGNAVPVRTATALCKALLQD